jgi:hypothetical protein
MNFALWSFLFCKLTNLLNFRDILVKEILIVVGTWKKVSNILLEIKLRAGGTII